MRPVMRPVLLIVIISIGLAACGGGVAEEDRLFNWKITGHYRYFDQAKTILGLISPISSSFKPIAMSFPLSSIIRTAAFAEK
jgi:hypothetical protein